MSMPAQFSLPLVQNVANVDAANLLRAARGQPGEKNMVLEMNGVAMDFTGTGEPCSHGPTTPHGIAGEPQATGANPGNTSSGLHHPIVQRVFRDGVLPPILLGAAIDARLGWLLPVLQKVFSNTGDGAAAFAHQTATFLVPTTKNHAVPPTTYIQMVCSTYSTGTAVCAWRRAWAPPASTEVIGQFHDGDGRFAGTPTLAFHEKNEKLTIGGFTNVNGRPSVRGRDVLLALVLRVGLERSRQTTLSFAHAPVPTFQEVLETMLNADHEGGTFGAGWTIEILAAGAKNAIWSIMLGSSKLRVFDRTIRRIAKYERGGYAMVFDAPLTDVVQVLRPAPEYAPIYVDEDDDEGEEVE